MLLLREDLLPELALRLPPLALGLLLRLELLRLLLLPPLDALPRLLPELLREGDEPDFEDVEELRDAMACSLVRLVSAVALSNFASATRPI
ncbi:hypothetical protein [Ramlibacter sp. AN1133]|uniref:hypothetical protein n=1 Tax=Ramlibacter sp. AN1133 TaxID=3133429 RepID=UPI0030BEF24F